MHDECSSQSSARTSRGNKLRSSICCFHCESTAVVSPAGPRRQRTPHAWLKSTSQDHDSRDRCRRVKARIKESCRNTRNSYHHQSQRRNHGSAEFSYDQFSYALNFEDDGGADNDETCPSFTARLPASPERKESRGIVQVC